MKKMIDYSLLTSRKFYEKTYRDLCFYASSCAGGGGAVTTFNGRSGAVTLTEADVTTALGGMPPTSGANFLVAATDASGNIIDGTANVITRTLTGFSSTNSAITAADTIVGAFGKAQGQIDTKISLSSPITGFAVGANSTMLAADTLIAALGKVQGQLNARITTATVLSAYTVGANTALANTDNIITMLGKIQGQINARALTSAIPAAANPTASVGTTATNGVATTFMRSDAAPAINLAMTPTWSGVHTFSTLAGTGTRGVVVDAAGALQVGAAVPVTGSSPTLTFDPVPANGFLDLGFNITGAEIGDVVALGIPAAAQVDGVIFTAMVSNTNVITVRCHNFTGSPISIPGGTYKATVFK